MLRGFGAASAGLGVKIAATLGGLAVLGSYRLGAIAAMQGHGRRGFIGASGGTCKVEFDMLENSNICFWP